MLNQTFAKLQLDEKFARLAQTLCLLSELLLGFSGLGYPWEEQTRPAFQQGAQ